MESVFPTSRKNKKALEALIGVISASSITTAFGKEILKMKYSAMKLTNAILLCVCMATAAIATDGEYLKHYDTLKKRYNDQEVTSFFDSALSDVPAYFKKAWSQHPHLITTHTCSWAQEFGHSLELAANGDWTGAKMHLTRANIPEIDDRGPVRTTMQVPKADYLITACLLDKMLGNEPKSTEELQSVYDLHQKESDFNNLDSCSLFWHFKRNQRE